MNHAVVSPTRVLMGAYLGLGRIRSIADVASGLFLCTIFLQVPQALIYIGTELADMPSAVRGVIEAIDPRSHPLPLERSSALGTASFQGLGLTAWMLSNA